MAVKELDPAPSIWLYIVVSVPFLSFTLLFTYILARYAKSNHSIRKQKQETRLPAEETHELMATADLGIGIPRQIADALDFRFSSFAAPMGMLDSDSEHDEISQQEHGFWDRRKRGTRGQHSKSPIPSPAGGASSTEKPVMTANAGPVNATLQPSGIRPMWAKQHLKASLSTPNPLHDGSERLLRNLIAVTPQ